jgi:hypothetical protein
MTSTFNKSLLVGIALSAMASPAFSSPVTANVQFWSYDAAPTFGPLTEANEGNPIINTTPTATFTYSGDLNWVSQAINTVEAFIGLANKGGISNFVGASFGNSVDNFFAAPLSVGGDTQATFWRFTGFLSTTSPSSGSITHDDGVTFYVGKDLLVNSPVETPSDTDSWVGKGPYTNAAFILDYVAGNGVPEILSLNVTTPTTFTAAVPEPSTWLMMIAGFFGLGFMAYRRKDQGSALRVA